MGRNEKVILCIDKGQSAVKAAFYDLAGNELLLSSRNCATLPPRNPGWLEQSMQTIWNDTVDVIRDLLYSAPKNLEIAGVSFSGHGGGLFLLDRNGNPLYPGLLSMDSRSDQMREILVNRGTLSPEEAKAISHVVLKLLWIKENEPEIYRQTAVLLGAKDWIRFKLTGMLDREVTDPPVPVDSDSMTYDVSDFRKVGLEDCLRYLPKLRFPSDIVGTVTKQAAEATGIPESKPVVAGAHDMMACSAGVGGYFHGHITSILGTMGINVAAVDKKLLTKTVTELRYHMVPGMSIKINNMGSACRSLDWYASLLYPAGDFSFDEKNKGAFYSALNARMDALAPGSILCLPYLNGEMRGAKVSSGFTGIRYTSSRDDIMRSVFEGLAFATAERLQALSNMVGVLEVWIVGGGSKSRLICQTVANAINSEVNVAPFSESGCRGGALCAYMALAGNAAVSLWEKPKPKYVYIPEKDKISEYAERFSRFIALKQNMTI